MKESHKNTPKMSYEELHAAYQQQQRQLADTTAELKDAHTEIDDLHNVIAEVRHGDGDRMTVNTQEQQLTALLAEVEKMRDDIKSWVSGAELSTAERRQLQGAGMRRYGFIDAVSDVMITNPQFVPSNVDESEFKDDIRKFEIVRNIVVVMQQALRMAMDIQLVMGDGMFRQALSYYGAVRDAARRRVAGAHALFRRLQVFFASMRRFGEEPTEHEVERDAKALLHGRKVGEVIIKNEAEKVVKGERVMVDKTESKKAKGKWKETESGEIDED